MTYQYVGNGDYIHGVPARDLTPEEYTKHQDAIDANATATGRALYVATDAPWPITDEIDPAVEAGEEE
jgi:hypothetical protein